MRIFAGTLLRTAACLLLLSTLPASAESAGHDRPWRGRIELAGALSFDRSVEKVEQMGVDPTGINVSVGYQEYAWTRTTLAGSPAVGWFVTDHVELVARFGFERIWTTYEVNGEKTGDDVDWTFGTGSLVLVNFPRGTPVVPYLGAGAGVLWREDRRTTKILPRLQAGTRFLFGNAASLNMGIYFEQRWNDEVPYFATGDTKEYGFTVGISFFLRSGRGR